MKEQTPGPKSDGIPLLDFESLGFLSRGGGSGDAGAGLTGWDHGDVSVHLGSGSAKCEGDLGWSF